MTAVIVPLIECGCMTVVLIIAVLAAISQQVQAEAARTALIGTTRHNTSANDRTQSRRAAR